MLVGIGIVIVGIIIAVIISSNMDANEKIESDTNALATLPDFSASLVHHAVTGSKNSLALSVDQQKFAILPCEGEPRVFDFDQLVAVEVEQNGSTLTKTNRGSQAAGAAIGGALLGPAGLIVGGLSGSSRQVEKVSSLALKIYTNDLMKPVYTVSFIDLGTASLDANNALLKEHYQNLDEWYGRFRTILAMRPA
ncbi:hypothetical protein [Sphingomicrobium arenosum]|uniref:hypothetical protein n=1 Tax=Sphingomicrobium arenosum TaxID=2233861 RepID=UPI00223F276A|nr:hypothetical protein [Sphingomicrobium arenosum]